MPEDQNLDEAEGVDNTLVSEVPLASAEPKSNSVSTPEEDTDHEPQLVDGGEAHDLTEPDSTDLDTKEASYPVRKVMNSKKVKAKKPKYEAPTGF